MSDYICLLITVYYRSDKSLITCALKLKVDSVPVGLEEFSQEYKRFLWERLPDHVRSCGPIVRIDPLFEIEVVDPDGEVERLNDRLKQVYSRASHILLDVKSVLDSSQVIS